MILIELLKTHLLFQFRNRQILWGTVFFAIFLIFLFNLAFQDTTAMQSGFFSGIFWISSFFAGNLVLTNQTHMQSNQFQQGLVLTGTDPVHLFFAKFISSLIYMLLIQVILLLVMGRFFYITT